MEAARVSDEETSFLAKSAVPAAPVPVPSAIKPPEEKVESNLEDELVVVATYDGQWSPVEAAK
jgi:hypothetical protein